ncbi:MAG TPA: FGGY family carbohydrate kinase [Solirubrobacteraceae bacterium]|nr:FGGY family carbohydrate kinase [Solirubrobacteraceae bacterium]
MAYVVGIDVGSQSVKAVLVDEDGDTRATASAPCDTHYPASGWAEQDARRWEEAITQSIRELRRTAGIGREEVTMLALACQVDGLVALDRELRPLRPAIIWLDRRATAQSARLSDAVGEAALIERTGLNPDASHTAPKAMWLRDEEPHHFRAARWLVSTVGHLNGWLTGEVVQDHADASSSLLYNLATRDWCGELVGLAGLDPDKLPAIRPAHDVIGPLRAAVADQLGLSTRCHVAVGTGDDHGAALGAGAVAPGIVVDVTGTAEPVAVPSRELVLDELRLVETHAHAVDGMLLIENPGFVSGGSTSWWARAQGIPQGEVFAQAALAPPGSDGALFLPTLSGSTAPRWNDRMRGCFAGIGLHHELAHMSRAILEGCSFALRDIVDRFAQMGLGGEEIRVVGGGSRSPLWLQIKADVTGRTVRVVRGETTSAGAAMLAGVASGLFTDLPEAASRMVRIAPEPVVPRPETRERYEDAYRAYRRLYDGVEQALAVGGA